MRDELLVQKLCETLENILADTLLPDGSEDQLLSMFGRHLHFCAWHARTVVSRVDDSRSTSMIRELEDREWSMNGSESQVRIPDAHSRLSS